jgi:hypothetical protein
MVSSTLVSRKKNSPAWPGCFVASGYALLLRLRRLGLLVTLLTALTGSLALLAGLLSLVALLLAALAALVLLLVWIGHERFLLTFIIDY